VGRLFLQAAPGSLCRRDEKVSLPGVGGRRQMIFMILIMLLSSSVSAFGKSSGREGETGTPYFSGDGYSPGFEKSRHRFPLTKRMTLEGANGGSDATAEKMSKPKPVLKEFGEERRKNWFYLIGLLVILTMIVKLLADARSPAPKKPVHGYRPLLIPKKVFPSAGPSAPRKGNVLFNVYYRDYSKKAMVFLGRIPERRQKDRGNNFNDLLFKARKDYKDSVKDPTDILILDS